VALCRTGPVPHDYHMQIMSVREGAADAIAGGNGIDRWTALAAIGNRRNFLPD